MALIEFRKPAIGPEVGRILRSMIAEALLDFQNSGLVNGGTSGSVLIVLNDKRIHKASEGIGVAGQSFRATERIGPGGCRVPVTVGSALTIGQLHSAHGSRE